MIRLLAISFFFILTGSLVAQSATTHESAELKTIASKFQLTQVQKAQAEQLIIKRNIELSGVDSNQELDELQKQIKRSSITRGFDGSINLLLNDDQKLITQLETIENRKKRIAAIELLKKKGYTQAEILKQLDHK